MAYSNWGAFVFRDGRHMPDREDQTPYQEDTPAGGHQIWDHVALLATNAEAGRQAENEALQGPHHAVLGSGDVRLCAYKNRPVLYVNGERQDLPQDPWWEDPQRTEPPLETWEGNLEGCRWSAAQVRHRGRAMIDLRLIEQRPEGGDWFARSGLDYGNELDRFAVNPTRWFRPLYWVLASLSHATGPSAVARLRRNAHLLVRPRLWLWPIRAYETLNRSFRRRKPRD